MSRRPLPTWPVNRAMDEPERTKAGFGQSIKAVAWSFFGVRRSKDHQADFSSLNPVHVIAAGLLMAGLFVLLLVTIVNLVVG